MRDGRDTRLETYLTYFSYPRYNYYMRHKLHGKKLYGTATVGTKGQIVIPSEAREELSIEPGDKLYIAGSVERKVLFCLKEEQLRALVEQLTSEAEAANKILSKSKSKKN